MVFISIICVIPNIFANSLIKDNSEEMPVEEVTHNGIWTILLKLCAIYIKA